jgi:hypothetical protein
MSEKTDKTLGKSLQHTCTTIATYAISRSTVATSISNTWNIYLKTPETYILQHGEARAN